jgi:hypothetical protein
MNVATKQRYCTPTATAYAEVSLSEFSREEIEGYLAHLNGEGAPNQDDEFTFSGAEISRISTLVLCGQSAAAREYVCEQISKHIGRKL